MLAAPKSLRSAFQALPPFLKLENFLGRSTVDQLLDYAILHEEDFKPSAVMRQHKPVVDPSFRYSKKLGDLGRMRATVESAISEALDQVLKELKMDRQQSPIFESSMVWNGDGAFFKPHIDTWAYQAIASSQRALTGIYYFHRRPKGFTGGHLRLYPLEFETSSDVFHDIEPQSNSIVFFPSWVPHEVLPVRCDSKAFADGRFTINWWYHRRVLPKEAS